MIYSVSRIRGIHIFSVFQAAAIPLIGYQHRNPKRLTHAMVVVGGARYLPPSILVVPYNLFKLRRTSQSKATAERIGQLTLPELAEYFEFLVFTPRE